MKRAVFVLAAVLMALPLFVAGAQSATRDGRTLTVSKSQGLSENGETVFVSGSGFDTEGGIYVAMCVIAPAEQLPSPCGGGANAASGASLWISNDPRYPNLATPWGEGGSFSGSITFGPVIAPGYDCRVVACAVYTRADHFRTNDRSADLFVPVTFGVQAPTATPTTGGTSGATPTATPSPTATPTPANAPQATVSADGLEVTAGTMVLTSTKTEDLDAEGETVTVSGVGYDLEQGVYVALCAVPEDGAAPGPCSAGGAGQSAWISSNPPDFGAARAIPFEPGGVFEVELLLRPVIDGSTDCREVACAIATRADDTAAADRTRDVLLPVSFAAAANETATPEASPSASPSPMPEATPTPTPAEPPDDSGGTSIWLFVLAGAGIAVLGAIAVVVTRKGRGIVGSALVMLALFIAGCGGGSHEGSTPTQPTGADTPIVVLDEKPVPQLPVTVLSADGREVTVTDTSRIVSLWGNITEVVYGLGLGDSVVGRDSSATFPEVADLPLVTRAHDTSAEGVLALNPTLVLASSGNSGPAAALDHIRNVGIPVIVFDDPDGVDDIAPRIREIAAALGVPNAGEELVAITQASIAESQDEIPDEAEPLRVAFLYMRGTAGVYLIAGPGSGADSMIAAAGGVDAGTAMGLDDAFTPITSEALAQAAPDVILMTTSGLASVGGIEGLVEIPGIAQTPAGKERRIVTIEDSLLYSYGPRTHVAIRLLIQQFYGGAPGAG